MSIQQKRFVAIFDWPSCLKFFNDAMLAKEMLEIFRKDLISNRRALNQAYNKKQWDKIIFLLEYLLGAAAYCGVPRLYEVLKEASPLAHSKVLSQITLQRIYDEISEVLPVLTEFLKH